MWGCSVTLDRDKSDVGTATAVWTAEDQSTFTHSRRLRITIADRNAFIAEAQAARDAWETRKTAEAGYKANLEAAFAAAEA